jgi:GTP-binding protein
MLVALNKVDVPEAQENVPRLTEVLESRGFRVFPISAATGEGVPVLLQAVASELREIEANEVEPERPQQRRVYTLASVDEKAWQAERLSRHHFAVTGIGVERFTRMTDFSREEGVERFQRFLETSGISQELTRLGVEDGDVVHIADYDLIWGEQLDADGAKPARTRRTARQRLAERGGQVSEE